MLNLFKTTLKCFGAAMAFSCAAAAMAGTPVYKIEAIENHDGLRPQIANTISRRGEIAGSAMVVGNRRAFVGYRYRDGKLTALPDSNGALVHGINKAGDVVGLLYRDSCIWYADGTREVIPDTWMNGINNAGQAVGSAYDTDEAIIYDHGVVTRLGKLDGGADSRAEAINDTGQVAGNAGLNGYKRNHGFVWKDGQMTDLGTLGGKNSWAVAINAKGHVGGLAETPDDEAAFVHDGTKMRAVPKAKSGANFIAVNGMNAHDELVGQSNVGGPLLHARNGQTYLLADLLDGSGAEWDAVLTAEAINDAGQIVGIGSRNGHRRAYVATPLSR